MAAFPSFCKGFPKCRNYHQIASFLKVGNHLLLFCFIFTFMWAEPNILMSLKWPMGCQWIILGLLLWSSHLSDEENGEQRRKGRRQRLCSLGALGARTGLCFYSMIGVMSAFFPRSRDAGPEPRAFTGFLPALAPAPAGRPGAGKRSRASSSLRCHLLLRYLDVPVPAAREAAAADCRPQQPPHTKTALGRAGWGLQRWKIALGSLLEGAFPV